VDIAINSLGLSSDGQRLFAAGAASALRVIDLATGKITPWPKASTR
jgi:hypothetical protein